jgi:predicted RNA-binding protein
MTRDKKYWIVVASKDHAYIGISNGIIQANHGKEAPLKRMHKGDGVIIYSGKEKLEEDLKYQKFTGVGEILDDEIFQVKVTKDFTPFRRKVSYLPSKDISIIPLIPLLSFIKNKSSWGYPFRFGLLEISEQDFKLIADKMLE